MTLECASHVQTGPNIRVAKLGELLILSSLLESPVMMVNVEKKILTMKILIKSYTSDLAQTIE